MVAERPDSAYCRCYGHQRCFGLESPTWQGGRLGVTSYSLQQTTDGGTNWSTITGPTGNVTEHTVTGLTSGTTYQWRVAGITSEGTGAYSVSSNAVTIS